jgi:thiamine-monophosphate kinase
VPDALASGTPVGALTERELIARIRTRVPGAPDWLQVGIGDDAAVIAPIRNELDVVTTDVAVEGIHFDRGFMSAVDIGHRALAANLSDLAAMGARPRYATLSIAAPASLPLEVFDGVVDGFLTLAADAKVTLVGGNLSRSPGPLVIDVLAAGTVRPRRVLTRDGARPGHLVFVSGRPGEARAGLDLCRRGAMPPDTATDPRTRFLRPRPRNRLGLLLARARAASACMDLSDGLADAIVQVAEASRAGMEIDGDRLPVRDALGAWQQSLGLDPVAEAIAGGDDYELLFTVPPKRRRLLHEVVRLADVPVTEIGVVTKEREAVLRRGNTREPLPMGFSHFGNGV